MTESLLTMITPAGLNRIYPPGDVRTIYEVWEDLIARLKGDALGTLRHPSIVLTMMDCACRRGYDIDMWASQAAECRPNRHHGSASAHGAPVDAARLSGELLGWLGFVRHDQRRAWLNRVSVELLYRNTRVHLDDRERFVTSLLDGPVLLQQWTGARNELARAVQLLMGFGSRSRPEDLLYMEVLEGGFYEILCESFSIGAAP